MVAFKSLLSAIALVTPVGSTSVHALSLIQHQASRVVDTSEEKKPQKLIAPKVEVSEEQEATSTKQNRSNLKKSKSVPAVVDAPNVDVSKDHDSTSTKQNKQSLKNTKNVPEIVDAPKVDVSKKQDSTSTNRNKQNLKETNNVPETLEAPSTKQHKINSHKTMNAPEILDAPEVQASQGQNKKNQPKQTGSQMQKTTIESNTNASKHGGPQMKELMRETTEKSKNQSKQIGSQIKELQRNGSKAIIKMQTSLEKRLQDQEKENKGIKKKNNLTWSKIQKLKQSNSALQQKVEQANRKNKDSMQSLQDRKSNLTAALAFAMSAEEDAAQEMQDFMLHNDLDESSRKEAVSSSLLDKVKGAFVATVSAPWRLFAGNPRPQSLVQSEVAIETEEDVVKQMSKLLADMDQGHSNYAASLKAAFDQKFSQGEELHQELLKEQAMLNATRDAEIELNDHLKAAVKHLTAVKQQIDKDVKNLQGFAKGVNGTKLQASQLGPDADLSKYERMTALTAIVAMNRETDQKLFKSMLP